MRRCQFAARRIPQGSQSAPGAASQLAAVRLDAARIRQRYRVVVAQWGVWVRSGLTEPSTALRRMCPSWFMPQERQTNQGAVGRCALCAPLVEADWQLDAALYFGWNVEYHADWHVQVDPPEVLVDTHQVVIMTVAGLWVEYRNAGVLVDYPDGFTDARPEVAYGALLSWSAVKVFRWVERVSQSFKVML